jgi:hypothetical protein
MRSTKRSWTRNTSGLEASAKRRAEATRLRVDEAIATLLRDPTRRVNFNTVAAAARVAKAYLYKEPTLRSRIDLLDSSRSRRDANSRQVRNAPRRAPGSWLQLKTAGSDNLRQT